MLQGNHKLHVQKPVDNHKVNRAGNVLQGDRRSKMSDRATAQSDTKENADDGSVDVGLIHALPNGDDDDKAPASSTGTESSATPRRKYPVSVLGDFIRLWQDKDWKWQEAAAELGYLGDEAEKLYAAARKKKARDATRK